MYRTAARRTTPAVALLVCAFALALVHPQRADAATYPTPTGFVVVSATTTSVSLDWKAVSGASGYRVRYAPSSTMTGAKSAVFRYSAGVVKGLTPNTKYWFRVAVAANHGYGVAQSYYTKAPYLQGQTKALPTPTPPPPPPPPPTPGSYDLQVATFNISSITADAGAPQPWAQRKTMVAQELLGEQPLDETFPASDVIALQEANTTTFYNGLNQYTDLIQTLNANVRAPSTAHYAAIPGPASGGTRIAYNDATLTQVEAGAVTWDAQDPSVGPRSMEWAIFRTKSTGDEFFFASNHLETTSETVRRAQWEQLIKILPTLSRGLPTVFAGDFNSPRGSVTANPTASVMLPKMGPAGYPDTLGQAGPGPFYVSTSRAQHVTKGNVNSLNKFSRNLGHYANTDVIGQDIDYIFASTALVVKQWAMVTNDGGDYVLDGVIPSDHNMVRATITIP